MDTGSICIGAQFLMTATASSASAADRMERGTFVFTSNVDGHFQKAGFTEAQVAECHGSIHWLQCVEACRAHLWSADVVHAEVDEVHCRSLSPLPACPHCAAMARPNILMFGDGAWIETRTEQQMTRLRNWLPRVRELIVVELGAGLRFPQYGGSLSAAARASFASIHENLPSILVAVSA